MILRHFSNEAGSYTDLKKVLVNSVSKTIIAELNNIESTLFESFCQKLQKIIQSRQSILTVSGTSELKELYELCEKVSFVCKNLSIVQNNPIILVVSDIQKNYLATFHDRKISEIKNILDSENWNKIEIPEEMNKFVMERRGEAARIAGIKIEPFEITATSNLLIFYKIVYEYIKLSEDLQIPLDCA